MPTNVKRLEEFEKGLDIEKKGLTITVSGQSGSGKSTIARSIAKELNLRMIDAGDIFREMAKEKNMTIEEFSATRGKEADYELDKRTLKFAKEGNVLLSGRLTGWVAGDNADIKVFVSCSIDARAKRVMSRDNKTFEEAKKDLTERDKDNAGIYKKLYDIDTNDLSIYDLVGDNTKMTMKEAKEIPARMVKDILKRKGLI